MDFSANSRSAALPRTYIGRWMRASMLDHRELRDDLTATLNGGRRGWNDDEPAVVEAAFELMLRRYYGPEGPDGVSVEWLASLAQEAFAADKSPIDARQAETIIRAALGDSGADLGMIRPMDGYRVRGAVAAFLSVSMKLGESVVDETLREAERLAFERGFHPPLAPRGRAH
jgi:hypothetical protein